MKKLLLVFFIFVINFTTLPVFAQDDLQNKIDDLVKKIEQAQSTEKSLNSQISKMDNQINLAELNIRKTESEIQKLGEEILDLTDKIGRLETTLSHLLVVFSNRVVNSYKTSRITNLALLFSASNLSDLLSRSKYIQLVQLNDQQVMQQVQTTKMAFNDQRDRREEKKATQETLKKQLEIQKAKLNNDRKAKKALLDQTKNDEATYQKLLQQALAEKQAIEQALINGVKEGSIKKGDPIALMGNTGYPACSTGTHLHFEIRRNNQWINPGDFLKNKTVNDQQNGGTSSIGSGDWDWPIDGDIILTQHYGLTPYSWRYSYSGGIHTGLDLYSNSTSVIRAPKDGTLYSSSQNCGGSSVIKIKYIEHGDGLVSFYLHVQ